MKILLTTLFMQLAFWAYSQTADANKLNKPCYAGKIEYSKGGFGGYNYPVIGDSVLVYITDSTKINVTVFLNKAGTKLFRDLHIDFSKLKLIKKSKYDNIVTPDKTVPTKNFDVMFKSMMNKSNKAYMVNITHYAAGNDADLHVIVEDDGVTIHNLFIAKLIKVN